MQAINGNPLFNTLVTKNIFDHLPTSDLPSCRLVCKHWADDPNVLKRLGEETTLIFDEDKRKLSNYVLDVLHQIEIHNRRPFLKKFDAHLIPQRHEQMSEFIYLQGPRVEYFITTVEMNLVEFIQKFLYKMPNLHTLHIYNISVEATSSKRLLSSKEKDYKIPCRNSLKCLIMQETRVPVTEFLTDFFTAFKNIEEINLKCDNRSDWTDQAGIWKEHSPLASSIIDALMITENCKKLISFKCGILDKSHLEKLTEMGKSGLMTLLELEIYCPARDVSKEVLTDFLKAQSSLTTFRILGNIRKLRRAVGSLDVVPKENEVMLEMPDMMQNLVEFQLSGRDKDTPIPLVPFSFGKQCPRLNVLIINGFAYNIPTMSDYFSKNMISPPCLTLKKLVIPSKIRDPKLPFLLREMFPNVKNLTVKAPDNKFLSAVWKCFDNLEVLKIIAEPEYSIERGITGIKEKYWDKIKLERDPGTTGSTSAFTENNLPVIGSGIHTLSNLKTLEIQVETEHNETPQAITDLSVRFSLMKMKSLLYLKLTSCCWHDGPIPCNYISPQCQADLVQELKDTIVLFTPVNPQQCE